MSEAQQTTRLLTRPSSAGDALAPLRFGLLAAMIVYVTMFDSMWIGPVPLWLLLPLVGLAMIAHFPSLTDDFAVLFHKLEWRMIVPWIFYIAVVAIFLFSWGTFAGFAGRRVVFTGMQLAALLVAATLAYSTPPRQILYLIAAIAIFQGIVCIGQVLQMSWARALPDLFYSIGGSSGDDAQSNNPYDAIKDMIRARGTLHFVHKFNPMQGMLAALLVVFSLAGGKFVALKMRYNRLFILAGAFFGTIGMVLTFSRSTVLGIGATVLAIWWRTAREHRFSRTLVVLILFGVAAVILSASESPLVSRLLSSDPFDSENISRTKQAIYTWSVLWNSPIFGAPMKIGPGEYPVHSVLFRIFTDFGLVGTIPYLAVILGALSLVWRYTGSMDPILRTTSLAAFGVMTIVLSDGWTHSGGLMQTDATQCVLLGVAFGMMFSAERNALRERERLRGPGATSLS
ncbi:MAG: O-antigen ligase family protein [Proteobacteria bacterium]|nr:O-antigen ligase family protein [Pseudomonadota bacterium]